jgi:tetratricopeptide (TPR) repeat protein
MLRYLLCAASLAVLLMPQSALRADVITYADGRVIKGLIEETAGAAENVTIQTDAGRLSIPKGRIANVQAESKAQGHIHIGDAFRGRQKYAEAMREYQRAIDLEPANPAARQGLDATQAAIDAQQTSSRQDALKEIDTITSDVQLLIAQKQFEKAEQLLQEADRRVPNDQQRAKLKLLISNLYYQWGSDRKDKLDLGGAEEKYRLALTANPDNRDVVEEMLRLWENKPDKREQIANIYATMLEHHPDDKDLRKKLADIYFTMDRYEDAAKNYLVLYQASDTFRGTVVEERLKSLLDRLHRQYARGRDYDKAIYYFQILATLDDETDPSQVIFYQYLKAAAATGENDPVGQLNLAQFAEKNGLDEQALSKYRTLEKANQTRDAARQGIARYAQKALGDAVFQYKQGNFELAMALANSVRSDFPDVVEVQDTAGELIGKAQAEAERNRRQARERSRDILKRADEFYNQATNYFNDLFSLERRNNPYMMSTRQEAIKYYRYAIQAYGDALRIDPSLAQDSTSLVNVRMNECRERLRKLTGGTVDPFRAGGKIPNVTQNTAPMTR